MKISKLYIDRGVLSLPETRTICERLGLPETVVDHPSTVFDAVAKAPDSIGAGKKHLFLTANKGAFVKPCPGTRHYRCCGYQILNFARYCTMDCSYCILQAYFHPPVLQYYVNRDDMARELDDRFNQTGSVLRIGTGEFTDSLIWEDCTDLTPFLVKRFAGQNRAILELKTKTVNIAALENLPHNRKTIMAWSLNTPAVIESDERHTTTIAQRLAAAAQCEAWGYPLAFHFDPMVIYDGCKKAYQQVIDDIFAAVSADNIVWISLGSFRFMPDLKAVIQNRFPDSKIIYGEFISGVDKKMRYFKPLRISLYQAIIDRIRAYAPQVTVYFCMEDDAVWERSLEFTPRQKGGLPRMLDQSAVHHCELDRRLMQT